MSLWRQITRGLRVLANRREADDEIADEVRHYFDQATAEYVAKGFSPDDARRAARMDLGTDTAVREQVRGYGWENLVEGLALDVRHALRRLARSPGFAAVSIVTLALGIGAATAIFSVIDGVLLKPLPYAHPEQLVALRHTAPGLNIENMNMAASLYFTYLEENRAFANVALWAPDSWTVTGQGDPEEVPGISASHDLLRVLRVTPAIGRGLVEADENPRSDAVTMLSDGYWRSRFGADPAVVGRRILVDGVATEVVGVLPSGFQFFDRKIAMLAPIHMDRSHMNLISFCCQGLARLKPGVTLADANADVARMLPMAPLKFPVNPGFRADSWAKARMGPRLRTMRDEQVGNVGETLWVLMGAVGVLLAIGCANVANLLLVRAEARRQEMVVRLALGAGWWRVARELLVESVLLAMAGGTVGLALAVSALRVLAASRMVELPRMHEIGIDGRVLWFTLGVSLGVGLLFGLFPAVKYRRTQPAEGIRGGGRLSTESRERHHVRGVLVVAQVGLAMVLLISSGLMWRTFRALRDVDAGVSAPGEVQSVRIGIPDAQAKEPEKVTRTEEQILARLSNVAGVVSTGAIDARPLSGGSNNPVHVEGLSVPPGTLPPIRRYKYISPGYLRAAGSRLIAGRDLTWAETLRHIPVALVSENMAREVWGSPQAALGKRIGEFLDNDWHEVVGVVADLRDDGVSQPAPKIVYWPLMKGDSHGQLQAIRNLTYLVRTRRAGTTALVGDLQSAVSSANASLPLAEVTTLGAEYERSLARTSLTLVLLGAAGTMALLVGVIGIYGVIAYMVSQRTREVGIRLALGAPAAEVTAMFVRQGLTLAGIGCAAGLAAAFGLTRLMRSLLYGVSTADPLTYAVATGALLAAVVVGSWLPARRAARVDPVDALRAG